MGAKSPTEFGPQVNGKKNMQKRTLGKSGLEVSALGLGMSQAYEMGTKV